MISLSVITDYIHFRHGLLMEHQHALAAAKNCLQVYVCYKCVVEVETGKLKKATQNKIERSI